MVSNRPFLRLPSFLVLLAATTIAFGATAGANASRHVVSSTGASVARPSAVTPSDWTTFDQNNLRTGVDPSGNSLFAGHRRLDVTPP